MRALREYNESEAKRAMSDQIDKMMEKLPPDLQQEVRGFARSLLKQRRRRRRKHLRLSWAGGLREFRDQFTSLELQRKALEWWGD